MLLYYNLFKLFVYANRDKVEITGDIMRCVFMWSLIVLYDLNTVIDDVAISIAEVNSHWPPNFSLKLFKS